MSLAQRFLALQLGLVLVISVVVALVMIQQTRSWVTMRAESVTRAATSVMAQDPFVRDGLTATDPTARLQAYAHRIEDESDIDFVTLMTPEGTRLTHAIPEYVGRQYVGDRSHALAGETYTETETGQLGPSVRTIAPVYDTDGSLVGLVSSGVLLDQIAQESRQQLPGLALIVAALLVMSSMVSYLLARYLSRATNGQAPEALVRSQALNDAVLAEAREGLVLLDDLDRPVLANARARHLLDMPTAAADAARARRRRSVALRRRTQPRPAGTLPASIRGLLDHRRVFSDQWCTVGARTLIVSCVKAARDAKLRVLIVQDHTELTRLSGELDTVRTMAAGLRAQTHEHANRMHTVVSLLELQRYPQALNFAASNLSMTRDLGSRVTQSVADPYLSALLLGKTAEAHERGVDLQVLAHGEIPVSSADPSEVVSVVGNLLDNAIDAAASNRHREEPAVEVELAPSERAGYVHLTVADTGPGVAPEVADSLFDRGVSTKPAGDSMRGVGLYLAQHIAESWGSRLRFGNDAGAVFTVEIPVHDSARDAEGDDS
ncbi:GHKL domain-containing protein [Kocuria sp. cx-116]|uniref:sensor histidine kinase n=1 Tax=Kocuria sp. cx-116 TaxID=2771378 RepID=UPI001687ABA7|nr:ATP-binding protein [Kocuria sp. cx-116]MBD2763432.1 GHKL domain-containing protein [Kocuria sp. cx-116]